jgi:uncharacterized protein
MTEVFLDTSFAIALASSTDEYHEKAEDLAAEIGLRKTRLVTTRAILLEIGNRLAKLRYRKEAVRVLNSLETSPEVEILPLSEDLYQRGFDLFRKRPDKEWGLVDCISFQVMQDRGITQSLTTDGHFEQAGFRALLRN